MRVHTIPVLAVILAAVALPRFFDSRAASPPSPFMDYNGMLPWPRHPADIVNLDVTISLNAGQYLGVYVPRGRWLVVSRFHSYGQVDLFENNAGGRTRKLNTSSSATTSTSPNSARFSASLPDRRWK